MGEIQKRVVAAVVAAILTIATPLVLYFEGKVNKTYLDPVGIATVCVGHTGPDVKLGETKSDEECMRLLQSDLTRAYGAVVRCISAKLKPHEAAALTSFAFNAGGDALCNSTMARMVNAGASPERWCAELDKWVYAQGKVLKGLVNRRAAERRMCEGKPWQAANDSVYEIRMEWAA